MSKQLLAIDDDDAIRIILKASLEFTTDWTLLTADSGKEGLEIAIAEQPDAILLDVMMPEMDGIEVFHKLKAQPTTQTVPVIFLTAQAREVERQALESLGVGVILKPFEPEAIANQIKALLNWNP